jgi:hypothetical protein
VVRIFGLLGAVAEGPIAIGALGNRAAHNAGVMDAIARQPRAPLDRGLNRYALCAGFNTFWSGMLSRARPPWVRGYARRRVRRERSPVARRGFFLTLNRL